MKSPSLNVSHNPFYLDRFDDYLVNMMSTDSDNAHTLSALPVAPLYTPEGLAAGGFDAGAGQSRLQHSQ